MIRVAGVVALVLVLAGCEGLGPWCYASAEAAGQSCRVEFPSEAEEAERAECSNQRGGHHWVCAVVAPGPVPAPAQ